MGAVFEVSDEIARAQHALNIALNHFAEATERRLIDAAVYEVTAATFRYDAAVDRAKRAERGGTIEARRQAITRIGAESAR